MIMLIDSSCRLREILVVGGDILVNDELLDAAIEGALILEREYVIFEIGIVRGVRILIAIDIYESR